MGPLIRACRCLVGLTAAGCLAACGYFGGGSHAAAGPQGTAGAPGHAAAAPADPLAADLVEAVSASHSTGPVDLKFALRRRPVAGQPLTVRLRLSLSSSLDRVEARFHSDDGLDIRAGSTLEPLERPAAGVNVEHDLVVVPEREGVYSLMATVTTTSQSESVSRSFSIPILVDPAAAAASGPVASGTAASGPAVAARH